VKNVLLCFSVAIKLIAKEGKFATDGRRLTTVKRFFPVADHASYSSFSYASNVPLCLFPSSPA
jgi:hypothetical protein